MPNFFKKIKNKLTGKKGTDNQENQQSSIYDRYGVREEDFQSNPLFEQDSENEAYNPLYGMELEEEPQKMENILKNIAGMPTKESIIKMAGGLKMEKLEKYDNYFNALNLLEEYQSIMQESHTVEINEKRIQRKIKAHRKNSGIDDGAEYAKQAFEKMKSFIIYVEYALKYQGGFFAKRSSNVRKLIPIFGNLLVQAYSLLPKLANLQYQVSPYVMATDNYTYTFEDVLMHQVTAGRTGGYAMRGATGNNGEVLINPVKAFEAIGGTDLDEHVDAIGNIANMRKESTEEARMGMLIPELPVGILKAQSLKAVNAESLEGLSENAEKIADGYIAELKILMRALDDVAESNEGKDLREDRMSVHGKQAEHFRMSKLLYRVISNKGLLMNVIVNGMPKVISGDYLEIEKLSGLAGYMLREGVAALNESSMEQSKFNRLEDEQGNDLQEGKDYIVGGGETSISILDKKNQRVLRAPKGVDGNYLSKEQQKQALNGINDEAYGKVAKFLGFNVAAQAEAAGFMARKKGESEETAVFGGSIMEMAKGVTVENLNLIMNEGDEKKRANTEGKENLNLMKNGRFLGDFMKMAAVDYIVMHGDRNGGNFLVNMDAKDGESTVTAIDNDMILGENPTSQKIGLESSIEALHGINNRVLMDYGSKLQSVFPMMTEEMKTAFDKLDLEEFEEMLMPYADRVTRMAAVHRAGELKEWAKKVPTCDLSTEKGTGEYMRAVYDSTMEDWLGSINIEGKKLDTSGLDKVSNTLIRIMFGSYGAVSKYGWSHQTEGVIKLLKLLGYSSEEVKDMLLKHVSKSTDKDEYLTEEELMASEVGPLLKNFDQL